MKYSEVVPIEGSFFQQYLDFIINNSGNLYSPMEWLEVDLALSKTEIIILLTLQKKELKVSDIGKRLALPLSTTTSIIDRLEQKKLVQRVRSNEDRRVVQVELTASGKVLTEEIINKMEMMMQKMVEKLTANLSAEEIKFLKKIFQKIFAAQGEKN